MTSYGHVKVMKSVGVAELKGNLSKHLRDVRRGQAIAVLDRRTPIAQIIPYPQDASTLTARRPPEGSIPPSKIRWPARIKLHHDPVAILLEERDQR